MNDKTQIKRGRGRPKKPDAISPEESQRRFIEAMKSKGYERFQTWAPSEFKPMVAEMNKQLLNAPSVGLKDKLRHHFVVAVMEALNRQRSIMQGAQFLRDLGQSESVVDEYIDECVTHYEMSARLDSIRCNIKAFLERREAEAVT